MAFEVVVIASENGKVGIDASMEILRAGGSAVDAVVAGIRHVESNPDDHSVGYSGLPNLLGEVELDASLMDGNGLKAGSVGALKGYRHAIDVAQTVMETLPHVLIAGEGSARLAEESGLVAENLLTPEAEEIWRTRFDQEGANDTQRAYYLKVRDLVLAMTSDPQLAVRDEIPHGTVNFIARDTNGNIATGVSTSGWAWKYPGRMGDSPIIGAGNYADNRFGGAACTGRGEMAQRCCTAYSVVAFMRFGMSLQEAVIQALQDLNALDDPFASEMNIVAMAADGSHFAGSTSPDRTYIYMTPDMTRYAESPRQAVPLD